MGETPVMIDSAANPSGHEPVKLDELCSPTIQRQDRQRTFPFQEG